MVEAKTLLAAAIACAVAIATIFGVQARLISRGRLRFLFRPVFYTIFGWALFWVIVHQDLLSALFLGLGFACGIPLGLFSWTITRERIRVEEGSHLASSLLGSDFFVKLFIDLMVIAACIAPFFLDLEWAAAVAPNAVTGLVLGINITLLAFGGAYERRMQSRLFYMSTPFALRMYGEMTGRRARVSDTLDPKGVVEVGDEIWNAETVDGSRVDEGEEVEIVSVKDLVLRVRVRNPD
ncbi:NfeD family protein [Thermodesulfobacteriota bacterium]